MAQGQDIFKVFVAKEDGIILEAGKKLKELKPGEIAIFDVDTNLSVEDFTKSKRFYFATNQDGKILKSPNRWVDKNNIKSISIVEPKESKEKVVILKDFKILCGKSYAVRINATNELTKFEIGSTAESAHLVADSKDCADCIGCADCNGGNDCDSINPIPVVYEILVNRQRSRFVKVRALARQEITGVDGIDGTIAQGEEVTIENLKALNTFNKKNPKDLKHVDLEFKAVSLPKDTWEEGYLFPRETEFNIGLSDSFLGNGTLETKQTTVIEQGSGFDIKHLEFTQINTESHSRYSEYGRMTFHPKSFAEADKKYKQISFRYGHKTEVTSHLYDHTSEVLFVIPEKTNIDAFKTILKTLEADFIETL